MIGSSTGWSVAEWALHTFADPELLIVLAAGVCALVGFWVKARVSEVATRDEARPADDLI